MPPIAAAAEGREFLLPRRSPNQTGGPRLVRSLRRASLNILALPTAAGKADIRAKASQLSASVGSTNVT